MFESDKLEVEGFGQMNLGIFLILSTLGKRNKTMKRTLAKEMLYDKCESEGT